MVVERHITAQEIVSGGESLSDMVDPVVNASPPGIGRRAGIKMRVAIG